MTSSHSKMKELRHQQRMLTIQLAAAEDTIADLENDSRRSPSVESSVSGSGVFDGTSGGGSDGGSLHAASSGASLISMTDPSVTLGTDSDGGIEIGDSGGGSGDHQRFVRFAPGSPVRQTVSSPDLGTCNHPAPHSRRPTCLHARECREGLRQHASTQQHAKTFEERKGVHCLHGHPLVLRVFMLTWAL